MKRLRVYVDTSILGGCCDDEFADDSRALIDMAIEGRVMLLVTDLLVAELTDAPQEVKIVFDSIPDHGTERLESDEESSRLRDLYLEAGVVGPSASIDAHHVALATVHKADAIVSWNFKHIVHFDKIRGFNAVNLREGYSRIEIYSPKEMV